MDETSATRLVDSESLMAKILANAAQTQAFTRLLVQGTCRQSKGLVQAAKERSEALDQCFCGATWTR